MGYLGGAAVAAGVGAAIAVAGQGTAYADTDTSPAKSSVADEERAVTTTTGEIIEYPIVRYDDLTIDPVYLELQQRGPIRIQLAFGEPCWVATRYEDAKVVYGDHRFGKALGIGRATLYRKIEQYHIQR